MKRLLITIVLLIFTSFGVMSQNLSNHIIKYNDDKSITLSTSKNTFNLNEIEELKNVFVEVDKLLNQETTKSLRDVRHVFKVSDVEIVLYRFGDNSFLRFKKNNETAFLFVEEGQNYVDFLDKYRVEYYKNK